MKSVSRTSQLHVSVFFNQTETSLRNSKNFKTFFRVEELKAARTLGERVEFTKRGPGTSTIQLTTNTTFRSAALYLTSLALTPRGCESQGFSECF